MNTHRPLIGITMDEGHKPTRYQVPWAYLTSVEKAGGMPFPIGYHTDAALIPEIVSMLDGIVFIGGNDLNPKLFGEERHPNALPLNESRQAFEFALLAEVERIKLPTLCICLGCQLLNVYRGGSLIQFLPEHQRANPIEHRMLGDEDPRHPVFIERDSLLGRSIGRQTVLANSSHKQAVNVLGRGLTVVAKSPDGIVEAVEDQTMPLMLGVQWHPERLHAEPDHLAIFRLLVDKSRNGKRG